MKMTVRKFKNKPVLELVKAGNGKPFSIGIGKAKLILDSIKTIKAFVDQYAEPEDTTATVSDKDAKKLLMAIADQLGMNLS